MQSFNGTPEAWNSLIAGLPGPHFLQTWQWGKVKTAYGWEASHFVWESGPPGLAEVQAAAMVLKRRVSSTLRAVRLNIMYIPKGPLMDWSDEHLRQRVLDDLQMYARSQNAIFLKADPEVVLGGGIPSSTEAHEEPGGGQVLSELSRRGWVFSLDQIQFRNTMLLELDPAEEDLLSSMKQKTRYNLRLAHRKGVVVRVGRQQDFPLLYRMYAETSLRDAFVIRDERYYQTVWNTFMQGGQPAADQPRADPLIAEVDGEAVAGLFLFHFARRAYFVYGMSRAAHREKMPTYLLQWEAILRAKANGCLVYDLWGAPDDFSEADPMWGVYRFKEGLGGRVVRTLGAWDYPARRLWYNVYARIVPRLLDWMRARGKIKTQRSLGGA